MTFQGLILKLSEFWVSRGCTLVQPLDIEVGAGTMHPETFLRVLGPAHWNVAYVQPSRRPADGRFGENPNRLFKHHQFQVILKPSPDEVQQLYLESLEACGINPRQHDIRFEEDNWESPTLGAWGIGWQILFDGLEITQFTYFQQAGGIELAPISAELTYGLERIAMVLQRVDSVYDLEWSYGVKYRDVRFRDEVEQSKYVFNVGVDLPPGEFANFHRKLFDDYYRFSDALLRSGLIWPALEHCLKCSHLFNILDSSNSIGVTERTAFILRIRQLAIGVAKSYVEGASGTPDAEASAPGREASGTRHAEASTPGREASGTRHAEASTPGKEA
jgi:glycyl-tRNA synthetase alpha chain